jgi:predicted ArsR family transcriptional regulator
MPKNIRVRRSPEQLIKDLEAKIANIKARAERKKIKRDPSVRHTLGAVRSIDKALAATEDKPTRQALDEARSTLSALLSLQGFAPKAERNVLAPRRGRAPSSAVSADAVLEHVRAHPGQRGEEIATALGTSTAALRPVMKRLIADGAVKTKGERRGMRYAAT